MVHIIFTDTNKIFGLFVRILQWKTIERSILSLIAHTGNMCFVISSYVIQELLEKCDRDWISYTDQHIENFISQTWFVFRKSHIPVAKYKNYVSDIDDAQIVQDAVENNTQYILTNNLKDFCKTAIYEDFGIKTINDILEVSEVA